jgi:hypothetical protein
MITVLASDIDANGDVWFKVKLNRSTDVLVKELFTAQDIKYFKKEAVEEFLNSHFQEWKKLKDNS